MRKLLSISSTALLALFLGACNEQPTAPLAASAAASSAASSETVDLTPEPNSGVTGTSTLLRRNDGFSFRVNATGLVPHRAVTYWAVGLDSDFNVTGVGRAAGGIVGGAGSVTLSGNNCLDAFPGKQPGTAPSCDLVDPAGTIVFALLQGDEEWTPGSWASAGRRGSSRRSPARSTPRPDRDGRRPEIGLIRAEVVSALPVPRPLEGRGALYWRGRRG